MRNEILFVLCLCACGGGAATDTTDPTDVTPDESGDEVPVAAEEETSSAPSPSYTVCEPAQPDASCAECDAGLTIELRRTVGWRADRYAFEILSEGNHIRCRLELPCSSADPVRCDGPPEAGVVTLETTGCGGPEAGQALSRIRFARDACPGEVRIEAFKGEAVRIAAETITPSYRRTPACGATCSSARATLTMRR